jgi:uncharacterized Ntn-hydrolase superfamily protein
MTFSILVQDPSTGAFGAAVASRFFAVGALCTYAEGRVGALSTQALINPTYGPAGMALLRQGASAQEVVTQLVSPDPGREQRQFHVIDAAGRVAQHTGPGCVTWAGQRQGAMISVAGNMLAGAAVLDAMLAEFEAAVGPLALRLIAALQAGEDAGGDKRGKQSAAVRVHLNDPYPDLDIRADDHPDPLAELRRLHRISLERFAVFRTLMAGRDDPWGVLDRTIIEDAVARDGQPLS